MTRPIIKYLDSGYWYARWSGEIWAQWPVNSEITKESFFNSNWTATPERIAQCREATK